MIEAVELADLTRLGVISDDGPRPRQRASKVLMEIIARLPRPRAYISEPAHMPEAQRSLVWEVAYDMLTAVLAVEGVSVIEPETIRDIALFSPFLEPLTDSSDALWQTLASCNFIDQVYIPDDGENCKRHAAIQRHADILGIKVLIYRPAFIGRHAPATPPRL